VKRGGLDNFLHFAHGQGHLATLVVRANVFGTRYAPHTNAGTAAQQATVGIGKHSVWQGPRQILSGAPILKRDSSA